MSVKPDTTHLSRQANKLIDIIQDSDLSKVSGLKMESLVYDLTNYEERSPNKLISNSVKTAGLVEIAVVGAQMADYMASTSSKDYEYDAPENQARNREVNVEVQALMKAAYNDPIINPSKPVYGDGYFDIKAARADLSTGKDVSSMIMPKGMSMNHKDVLLEAVDNLPPSLQQLAVQGMRMAADDAKKQSSIGSMKTTSLLHSQDVISDNLDAYQAFRLEAGSEVLGRTLSERFDANVYAARGRQDFEAKRDNPNVESNKPLKQIEHSFGNSLSDNLRDGLNNDIKELRNLSQEPHTRIGDWRIKDLARGIADNSSALASNLHPKVSFLDEKDPNSVEVAKGYMEAHKLLESSRNMVEEMPDRDRMLERNMDRAGDNFTHYVDMIKFVAADNRLQAQADAPKVDEPAASRGPSGP